MSEEWKAMSEEEKQPYKDAAAADAERARAENEAAGLYVKSGAGKKRKTGGARKTTKNNTDDAGECTWCCVKWWCWIHATPPVPPLDTGEGAQDEHTLDKPKPVTKRQQALAATQAPSMDEYDEQTRLQCDWVAHPAEAIIAETFTGKVCGRGVGVALADGVHAEVSQEHCTHTHTTLTPHTVCCGTSGSSPL